MRQKRQSNTPNNRQNRTGGSFPEVHCRSSELQRMIQSVSTMYRYDFSKSFGNDPCTRLFPSKLSKEYHRVSAHVGSWKLELDECTVRTNNKRPLSTDFNPYIYIER